MIFLIQTPVVMLQLFHFLMYQFEDPGNKKLFAFWVTHFPWKAVGSRLCHSEQHWATTACLVRPRAWVLVRLVPTMTPLSSRCPTERCYCLVPVSQKVLKAGQRDVVLETEFSETIDMPNLTSTLASFLVTGPRRP